MRRALLVGAITYVLTAAPGAAQDNHQRLPTGAAAVLVGLPVFTSDGREIGKVTGLGRNQRDPVLIAEIKPLGVGPHTVAIPIDMFVQRVDSIKLTITSDQVEDRLAGPEPER